MRIAIATVRTPFIQGGAELLASGLHAALLRHGHEADVVSMPFAFSPAARVERAARLWLHEDFEAYGAPVDRVICLKFPAYYGRHPRKVLWLLHQHRAHYDLWAPDTATPEDRLLRDSVVGHDAEQIAAIPRRFTISRTVSDRLLRHNGITSEPLLHPPALAGRLYNAPDEMFIFCPSRLETLKRQALLIEAMRHVRAPVVALIAGTGGQEAACRALIELHDLGDRVRLLGAVDDEMLLGCYASCLAVFFGPQDEDYGYVTLEAMLSGKPVITCRDSGGPLEFVRDGETGLVADPAPQAIAEAIERLAADRRAARLMGQAGAAAYHALPLSWDIVVDRLLA